MLIISSNSEAIREKNILSNQSHALVRYGEASFLSANYPKQLPEINSNVSWRCVKQELEGVTQMGCYHRWRDRNGEKTSFSR